ncbi:MAG: helix-turn-helix domain-containing protein [Desulfovibrio sp.]|nr:helix-turn-helix domain-containing protein [Desulfovibrio sp.]
MSALSGKTTFTLAQAAELLNCHRETLRRAIRNGELRAAKLGREFRISRFDLEAFWISSGGGELFGGVAEENAQREPPQPGELETAKKKRGRKPARGDQEQFSLLHSPGADAKKKRG